MGLHLRRSCFYRLYSYLFLKIKFHGKLKFNYRDRITITSSFEGANRIGDNSNYSGKMGYGSYIGSNCSISANIGRFTSIAPCVRSNHGTHPHTYPFVTTCPMFYSLQKQNGYTFAQERTFDELLDMPEIGSDCWIGEYVFICGRVKINDGAVVLAGAVVTKDVPSYAIVGGVPAKIIKYRYDEDTIAFLTKIKWWNNELEWLRENWTLLNNMEDLKDYYKNHFQFS